MRNAVFSFSKPVKGSTVVSNHLARFIAKTLDLPLYYDNRIKSDYGMVFGPKLDILFIVNGAYAFCDCLADLAPAIRRATRVVWIQNDYTIKPPRFDVECKAESPFRKAFVYRAKRDMLPTDYWTTVEANASATPLSRYMNWNAMTCLKEPRDINRKDYLHDLFYYGAYRIQRGQAFDRYFTSPLKAVPVVVSSTSKKFAERYPDIGVQGGQGGIFFYDALNLHGLGLYIEDTKSHTEWHSPANRFYEMLSAGLPMVFQPEAAPLLETHGIPNVTDFVIERKSQLIEFMATRNLIAIQQRDWWWRPYRTELRRRLKDTYDNLLRRHSHGT